MRSTLAAALVAVFLVFDTAGRAQDAGFSRIDSLVQDAIAAKQTPGAVVTIGQGDRTLYEKAFGSRAVAPAVEPMSVDTVFDVASLTKVVATTTAVMTLIESGRLRLNDPVATHVPGFERYGKGNITIRHLLTHVSGLRPDVDLHPWTGYDTAIELAIDEVPTAAPNEAFVYSDINFFLLGHIVRRISGETLDAYAKRVVFDPLGMKETGFNPAQSLLPRIAPTERCAGPDPGTPCKRPDAPPRTMRACRSCAAWCTIRPRGGWTASRGTPVSSAPPPIWRASAGCC